MGLLGLILIGVIIWIVVMANQKGDSFIKGGGYETKTPLDIARERYAKGEISQDEFEAIKKNLI